VEEGILKQSDYDGFLELCLYYGEMQELRKTIKAEGDTVEDRDGNQRKNPAIPRLKDCETKFLRLSNRFGLNPSARGRRAKTAELVKKTNDLDMFRKAQQWVNETSHDRMMGVEVQPPDDIKAYFGWAERV
jgi:P27 family predicted phage terminase small subunit